MKENLANCAIEAALKAGKILKEGFGTNFEIGNKEGRNNLVTEYDHLAEKTIIGHIKSEFPDHNILAEESGASGDESNGNVRWIIDPLDGTVNFAHSLPIFSISIAAEYQGELLCGIIYHPILNELFVAIKGQGATKNGKKISVTDNKDFNSSFLVTGFPYNVDENPLGCLDQFITLVGSGLPVRRLGSAALDLAYVASGIFDVFWEINLNPWDVAAGVLLVQEAGGRVTQFDGNEYNINNNSILATNGLLHDDISKILMDNLRK